MEGLLPVADKTKNGLMPAILAEYTTRIRIINVNDGLFTKIIQINSAVEICENMYMVVGSSNYNTPEMSLLLVRGKSGVGFYRVSGRNSFFIDSSYNIYIRGINYTKLYLVPLTLYGEDTDVNTYPMEQVDIDESELTELISSNV